MARFLLGTAIILAYNYSVLGNIVSSEIASESFANPSNRLYSYRLPVPVKGEVSTVRLLDDRRQARNLYVDPDDERRHDYTDNVISNRFQRSLIDYNESAVDRRLNCTKINPHREELNWNYTDYNIPVQDRNETIGHHWNRSQSHCGNRFQRNLINYNESAVYRRLNCTKINPHQREPNWNYTDYIPDQDRNETIDHHRNRSQSHCRRFGWTGHPPHSNRSRPLMEHFGRMHPHSNHSHPNLEDFGQNRTSFNHSRQLPERLSTERSVQ